MNISVEEERAISERIVRDFGDGTLKGGYLFEQIKGDLGKRVRLCEALQQITVKNVVVLLDRHPNNRTFAQQVMTYLGMSETWGFVVPTRQLQGILLVPAPGMNPRFVDCL